MTDGPTANVAQPCACWNGKRLPPPRIHTPAARAVAQALAHAGVDVTDVLLDYRCPTCKQVVPLRIYQVLGAAPGRT